MTAVRRAAARTAAVLGVLAASWMVVSSGGAVAETRSASVGNYWFEDDAQKDRGRIVARQGDQITFVIRETTAPPHSVNVDELAIRSGDLPLLFDTYTTPPLSKAGTFRLYCEAHQDRNHVTTLIVQAASAATPGPTPRRPGGEPNRTAEPAPQQQTPAPGEPIATAAPGGTGLLPVAEDPVETLTPVGRGRAPAEDRRAAPPAEGSLDDLLGRSAAQEPVPWTRAVWFALLAAVPVLGVGAAAALRGRRPGASAAPGRGAAGPESCRVVTLSRSIGAGGERVGRLVAERLGFRYVDEEIVLRAAEIAGVEAAEIRRAERVPGAVDRILDALRAAAESDAGSETGSAGAPNRAAHRRVIEEAIRATAREGRVVIVAHAAAIPLAGTEGVLRVLVTASQHVRARRLVESGGLTERQAERAVAESDRARREYLKGFYDLAEEQPTHYDLVVNTDTLDASAAADQIVAAATRARPNPREEHTTRVR